MYFYGFFSVFVSLFHTLTFSLDLSTLVHSIFYLCTRSVSLSHTWRLSTQTKTEWKEQPPDKVHELERSRHAKLFFFPPTVSPN